MNPASELREIAGQLKRLIISNMEMGSDFSRLSSYAPKESTEKKARKDSLEDLRALIGDCRRCKLWRGRSNLVFGEGSPKARLVFVGEGPGHEEGLGGGPFVGGAGKVPTRIIEK